MNNTFTPTKGILIFLFILFAFQKQGTSQSPFCNTNAATFCCEYISSISINSSTINTNINSFNTGPSYFDFSNQSLTNLTAGQTYPISIKVRTVRNMQENVKVFFDFNRNSSLIESEELVFNQKKTFSGYYDFNGLINIPPNALNGQVFIRIVMSYDSNSTICGSYDFGNTIDLKATISNGLNSNNLTVSSAGLCGASGSIISMPFGINTDLNTNSVDFSINSNVVSNPIGVTSLIFNQNENENIKQTNS